MRPTSSEIGRSPRGGTGLLAGAGEEVADDLALLPGDEVLLAADRERVDDRPAGAVADAADRAVVAGDERDLAVVVELPRPAAVARPPAQLEHLAGRAAAVLGPGRVRPTLAAAGAGAAAGLVAALVAPLGGALGARPALPLAAAGRAVEAVARLLAHVGVRALVAREPG